MIEGGRWLWKGGTGNSGGISFRREGWDVFVGFSQVCTLCFILSVPLRPQYTACCSHVRSFTFSLDYSRTRAFLLSFIHTYTHTRIPFYLPLSFAHLSIINSSALIFLFNHLHSHAFVLVFLSRHI